MTPFKEPSSGRDPKRSPIPEPDELELRELIQQALLTVEYDYRAAHEEILKRLLALRKQDRLEMQKFTLNVLKDIERKTYPMNALKAWRMSLQKSLKRHDVQPTAQFPELQKDASREGND